MMAKRLGLWKPSKYITEAAQTFTKEDDERIM
jgi:hypothetical protein